MGHWLAFALLCATLVVAAVLDWRTGLVPNWLTYPAIVAGLLFWTVAGLATRGGAGALEGLLNSLGGFAAGFLPFAALFFLLGSIGEESGGGDVKLLGAIGALLGSWRHTLDAVVYGYVVALVLAVAIMVSRRIVLRTLGRILGALLMAVTRVQAPMPQDSPRLPMAAAFGAGGLLAGAQGLLGLKLPWSGFGG
jgi:prepilin peptidase CpaA